MEGVAPGGHDEATESLHSPSDILSDPHGLTFSCSHVTIGPRFGRLLPFWVSSQHGFKLATLCHLGTGDPSSFSLDHGRSSYVSIKPKILGRNPLHKRLQTPPLPYHLGPGPPGARTLRARTGSQVSGGERMYACCSTGRASKRGGDIHQMETWKMHSILCCLFIRNI